MRSLLWVLIAGLVGAFTLGVAVAQDAPVVVEEDDLTSDAWHPIAYVTDAEDGPPQILSAGPGYGSPFPLSAGYNVGVLGPQGQSPMAWRPDGSQLAFVSDDARAVALAREVIGNLDDNGYLMGSLAEIAGSLEAWTPPPSAEELEAALSLVQSLDPPGVGARDLRECLLLQLARERPAPTPELRLAREIIMRYLDELGRNSLPQIVKEVRRTAPELGAIDVDDVKNAHRIIASLDPKPGRTFGGTRPKYIRPDVIIEKIDGRYEVRLENGYFPRLTLKNEYRALMTGGRSDSETRKFLRRKFQDAEFLLKALSMRDHTLQRIAGEIAALQEGFFEKGVEHLRPLRLQDVAERLGIHLSTVSRAISGKYLQCPRGVFEMKFFFPGGASRQDGTSESRNSVMARLKDLIAKEDRSRPLSDEDLAVELKKQGIAISRRTVTKYREAEGIAASRERKVY